MAVFANQEYHWFSLTTTLTIPSLNLSAITLGKKFFSLHAQCVGHTNIYEAFTKLNNNVLTAGEKVRIYFKLYHDEDKFIRQEAGLDSDNHIILKWLKTKLLRKISLSFSPSSSQFPLHQSLY